MTVTPLNSYADFRNAVRRLISLRSRPTHIPIIDRHGTIRSTRAKSSSLTSGLRGVARAESSRPSLSNCPKGLTRLSSIRSMWTSKIRSRRKSAFVLYVAPPLAPLVEELLTASQMPTFAVFKDGNKIDELVGAHPANLQVCLPIVKCTSASH